MLLSESDLAEQLGEEPAGGAQGLGDRALLQQVGQDLAQDKKRLGKSDKVRFINSDKISMASDITLRLSASTSASVSPASCVVMLDQASSSPTTSSVTASSSPALSRDRIRAQCRPVTCNTASCLDFLLCFPTFLVVGGSH